MMVDPIELTPSAGVGISPYGSAVTPLLLPQGGNRLGGTVPTATPFTPWAYYTSMVGEQTRMLTSIRAGSVLHFGDSITQSFDVSQVSPFSVNFGIGGNTPAGMLYSLSTYGEALSRANAVCVMMGINSIRDDAVSAADIRTHLMRIFNWLSGPLVWTPIIHTTSPETDRNSKISTVNANVLSDLAARPQTAVADANAVLAPAGTLLAQYHIGDGLHLNAAGYEVWNAVQRAALATFS